jgi:hypothetical protein
MDGSNVRQLYPPEKETPMPTSWVGHTAGSDMIIII